MQTNTAGTVIDNEGHETIEISPDQIGHHRMSAMLQLKRLKDRGESKGKCRKEAR
jgi:hypothetical protein